MRRIHLAAVALALLLAGALAVALMFAVGRIEVEHVTLDPLPSGTTAQVFVAQYGSVGKRLAENYGEKPVSWCGGQRADWCSDKFFKDLGDQQLIAVLAFANARLHQWYKPPFTPAPFGEVTIRFYGDGKTIDSFGSGQNFFARAGLVRNASREEIEEFLNLVGIEPSQLAHPPKS